MRTTMHLAGAAFLIGAWCMGQAALGNGGPFVVKHPNGDPAAKGVLARLDPTLKPAQETRLRVIKEDLTLRFVPQRRWREDKRALPPLVDVTAAYQIENPTDQKVQAAFGFPILRGIFLQSSMIRYPDVRVVADEGWVRPTVISNSAIYGIIRQHARKVIESGIAKNAKLASLVAAVRAASPPSSSANQPTDVPPPRGMANRNAPRMEKPVRKSSADYQSARESLRTYVTTELSRNE